MTRAATGRAGRNFRAIGRRFAQSDDSGATLLMALIFITVVALVMGTILTFVDTSLRTTVAVRDAAARAAAADAAAQVAINALRKGTYQGVTGQSCFGSSNSMPLNNFYVPASGGGYSASVACTLDDANSTVGTGVPITTGNKPVNSILSLSRDSHEAGIYLHTYISNDVIQVHGNTFSNTNIDVDKIVSDSGVKARTGCSGTIVAPSKVCNLGNATDTDGNDPGYSQLSGSTVVQNVPDCNVFSPQKLYTFTPGLYTDLDGLNALTNLFCNGIYFFQPGVYYFDFTGSWDIDSGTIIGGTKSSSVVSGHTPTVPGSCRSPIPPDPLPAGGWTSPGVGAGVQFIFGGESRITLNNARMELCGSYSASSPPIAIYGLSNDIKSGSKILVNKESGCITNAASHSGSHCSVLSSSLWPTNELYVQGTTYTPLASINMLLDTRPPRYSGPA